MRPAGEVRAALLNAVTELATPDRAPTLSELTAHLGQDMPLGGDVVRNTVHNMARHGALRIVRTRRVAHRNRPVAEYAPAVAAACNGNDGFVDLGGLLRVWGG